MAKPEWNRPLKEVLGHDTKEVKLVSQRTGNEYTADIIQQLKVVATSKPEEVNDGKF